MAYVVWRVLMKKYTKARLGLQRNPQLVQPSHGGNTSESEMNARIVRNMEEHNALACQDATIFILDESASYNNSLIRGDVRRSKSRVRSYLKRCKDALIGTSSSAEDSCPTTHEAVSQAPSATSWYRETAPDDGAKVSGTDDTEGPSAQDEAGALPGETPAATTGGGIHGNERMPPMRTWHSKSISPPIEPLNNEHSYSCEGSNELTRREITCFLEFGCWITLPSMRSESAVDTDGGSVATLVDRYLSHLYPGYHDHVRSLLVRQARDLLVCTFHGNLSRFEAEFLAPGAELIADIKRVCSCGSLNLANGKSAHFCPHHNYHMMTPGTLRQPTTLAMQNA
ncbi:uncharacterized protein LOC132260659 [Phlebotomus argentipes]|uniref:uncharacterized protein LOC132260659 n=1 Tax=Phlebotomus argentipes TaxID=94469 RepID=UPI002893532E|nr:uncharacterized protein LOC132260659 [Phlebotomus argentipes]